MLILLSVLIKTANVMYSYLTLVKCLLRSHILDCILSLHTTVLMEMSFEGKNSYLKQVLSDVPQGTVLAPLLFLLYINDLPASITNKVKLYADDVLLYSYIYSESDCTALQADLDKLNEWPRTWLTEFNLKK